MMVEGGDMMALEEDMMALEEDTMAVGEDITVVGEDMKVAGEDMKAAGVGIQVAEEEVHIIILRHIRQRASRIRAVHRHSHMEVMADMGMEIHHHRHHMAATAAVRHLHREVLHQTMVVMAQQVATVATVVMVRQGDMDLAADTVGMVQDTDVQVEDLPMAKAGVVVEVDITNLLLAFGLSVSSILLSNIGRMVIGWIIYQ
jgi:hypothetical protein